MTFKAQDRAEVPTSVPPPSFSESDCQAPGLGATVYELETEAELDAASHELECTYWYKGQQRITGGGGFSIRYFQDAEKAAAHFAQSIEMTREYIVKSIALEHNHYVIHVDATANREDAGRKGEISPLTNAKMIHSILAGYASVLVENQ